MTSAFLLLLAAGIPCVSSEVTSPAETGATAASVPAPVPAPVSAPVDGPVAPPAGAASPVAVAECRPRAEVAASAACAALSGAQARGPEWKAQCMARITPALLLACSSNAPSSGAPAPRLPPRPTPPAPAATMVAVPAPLAATEMARYKIDYGLLGTLGEMKISLHGSPVQSPGQLLKAEGSGAGSILGFGEMERHISTEFDAQALASRRWVSEKRRGGRPLTARIDQGSAGVLQLVREEVGRGAQRSTEKLPAAVLDPVGLVLRIRAAPPAEGQTSVLHTLDSLSLWRITLRGIGREPLPGKDGVTAFRIEGKAEPLYYDGGRDGQRPERSFVLWLADTAERTPLRLSVDLGVGDVIVELVELQRGAGYLSMETPGARSL